MSDPVPSATTVTLRLNQQQLALLDRTIAKGAATDRVALVRRALAETKSGYAEGGVPRS